ncbi:MAG TPA: PASTA domain-containing protein, partial [Gemmatimonadales bacterium]|nr:PASTA domain-containing protein [Gemmatimonadales bacterium]
QYYGGQTAAPVVRRMLEQALASRRVALDRARLAGDTAAPAPRPGPAPAEGPVPTVVVRWPPAVDTTPPAPVAVPAVVGAPARIATLALHRRGLRVDLRGLGKVTRTDPAAGAAVAPGATVTVFAE